MSNPQSIRVSNRMQLALDRVRPLMARWAKVCDIHDMTGDDLSAARIIEDALMCYEIRLKQALDLHDGLGLAAELESSAEAIRRNIP